MGYCSNAECHHDVLNVVMAKSLSNAMIKAGAPMSSSSAVTAMNRCGSRSPWTAAIEKP
jgi:hypothetical protein